ncbi:MAG TPA: SRPBCC family protein [Burkholderiales bacterium]|nr:SRPBCC family protein [Burkholderiales bacterium]
MNRLLFGGAVGALAMYFLDPGLGRRRRALTRDKLVHAAKVVNEAADVTMRDTAHRAQGVIAEAKRLFNHDDVSDPALVARVRAALGRVVSHPHAVQAFVDRGHVDLSGPILADEVRQLLEAVRQVPGVRGVSDHLEVHRSAEGVSALQGGVPRNGRRFELWQDNWSPAARLLTGALGAGLMLKSVGTGRLRGALLGAAGGGLLARAVTNKDLATLLGIGGRGITVEKRIQVNAPPQEVFEFWTDYQNFPRFMANVKDVQRVSEGLSRWTVAGPAGVPVHWTAEVSRVITNRLIEWRATAGSVVRHDGSVRFDPQNGSGTRITVRLRYFPPAGEFGHAIAALFGADPKTEMDADLLRMKTMIETGRAPHDAARPAPN